MELLRLSDVESVAGEQVPVVAILALNYFRLDLLRWGYLYPGHTQLNVSRPPQLQSTSSARHTAL
jgi:hypothetical protein